MTEPPSSPGPDPAPEPDSGAPTTQGPAPRRFLRSREDRVIGGVCGGLAKYFGIDATLVRIAAVALVFLGGVGLIGYAAALAFVPEDDGTGRPATDGQSRFLTITGAVILGIGAIVLVDGSFGWFWGPFIPTVIVVGALSYVAYRLLQDRGAGRQPTAARVASATLMALAALVAAFLVFVAAAWAAAVGGGEVVAGLVIVIGVAMVIAGFQRPARWLALPALVLALPLGVVAAADIDAKGGAGERTHRPATVADIPDRGYELGVGELEVDLRSMDWPRTGSVDVNLELGVGHAIVLVPEDVCVRASADLGMGYVNVLGHDSGGVDVRYAAGTVRDSGHPTLVLDAQLGMGAVEVQHFRDRAQRAGRDDDPFGRGRVTPELARDGCAGSVR